MKNEINEQWKFVSVNSMKVKEDEWLRIQLNISITMNEWTNVHNYYWTYYTKQCSNE